MDTLMPWDVRVLIKGSESGSSGARVTSLTASCRLEEPYIEVGEVLQEAKREALWAPFFVGCR